MTHIRVLVFDESADFFNLLKKIVKDYPYINVLGYAETREKNLSMIKRLKPDVIIINIHLMTDEDFNSQFFKSVAVLILSNPGVDEIAKTIKAISLGAVDFINRKEIQIDSSARNIISKINNVYKRRKSLRRTIKPDIKNKGHIHRKGLDKGEDKMAS